MRVLVMIYEYPPVGGGGGAVARDISLGLKRRGHEVHVITAHYAGLPRQETQDGIQIVRVPSLRRSAYRADLIAMMGFVLAGGWASWRHLHTWRPDVIHVHFAVPSGPAGWWVSKMSGIPYVLTAHLGDVPGGVPEKTGGWFRWIYPLTPPIWRDAAQVAAVSEYTRKLAATRYPVDIHVIPNGTQLGNLDPEQICPGESPLIVFAGRFMPQKNPLQVVRSLAEVKHLPWRCLMMGDGPLRADVEAAIRSAGLEDRFSLPGWVTPEQVEENFARADVLFMPSLSEGLPVVGVRALACGLAVVAGRVGGFVDLVEPGANGYLIDASEPQEYARALSELLSAPKRLLAFRQASRRKAAEFDIERVTDAYITLFESAIRAK